MSFQRRNTNRRERDDVRTGRCCDITGKSTDYLSDASSRRRNIALRNGFSLSLSLSHDIQRQRRAFATRIRVYIAILVASFDSFDSRSTRVLLTADVISRDGGNSDGAGGRTSGSGNRYYSRRRADERTRRDTRDVVNPLPHILPCAPLPAGCSWRRSASSDRDALANANLPPRATRSLPPLRSSINRTARNGAASPAARSIYRTDGRTSGASERRSDARKAGAAVRRSDTKWHGEPGRTGARTAEGSAEGGRTRARAHVTARLPRDRHDHARGKEKTEGAPPRVRHRLDAARACALASVRAPRAPAMGLLRDSLARTRARMHLFMLF